MAILFSVLITVTYGFIFNAVQTNPVTVAFENSFHSNRLLLGIVLAVIAGLIIFGGVKRIARFTGVVVPIMATIYIAVAVFVLLINITDVTELIAVIPKDAFALKEFVGGGIGAAIVQGVNRGLYTYVAGLGSVPNATVTANVSDPVKQGVVEMLSKF